MCCAICYINVLQYLYSPKNRKPLKYTLEPPLDLVTINWYDYISAVIKKKKKIPRNPKYLCSLASSLFPRSCSVISTILLQQHLFLVNGKSLLLIYGHTFNDFPI